MPRCRKPRCCRRLPGERIYKPAGVPLRELAIRELELPEFEAMRLCDLDGLRQEEAGARMGVSRGTVQRLLESGRKKLLEAILTASAFSIREEETNEDLCTGRSEPERTG